MRGILIQRGGRGMIELKPGSMESWSGSAPPLPAAVRLGSAVLTGPSYHNFRDAFSALLASKGALEVKTADDIAQAVVRLHKSDRDAQAMRDGAETALASLGGALRTTLEALAPFLAKQRT